jgi:predicted MFS family arabinose efflux permease
MSALVAVVSVRLVDESITFLPAGSLELLRADLGLTYAQAGVVLAAAAPGAMVGTLASAAADHRSRRAIAAGGAILLAFCMAAFGAGQSFITLLLASFVAGGASTAMVDAAEVAMVDLAGDDLRPWLARSNLAGALGDLAGPALLAGVALAGWSWRAAFFAGAVLLAVYTLVLAAAPMPRPPPVVDGQCRSPRAVVGAVVRDRRVWVLGAMALLLGPFDEPFVGFTIALVDQSRGASPALANAVGLVGVSGGLITWTVLAGRIGRVARIEDRRLLVGAGGVMAAAALVTFLVPIVAAAALGGLFVAMALNVAWLALQHQTLTLRPGQAGTTKAVTSTIEFAGFGLPIAIGAAVDRTSLPVGLALYGALGICFAVLAARAPGRKPA